MGSRSAVLVAWVVTRALSLLLLFTAELNGLGDVLYLRSIFETWTGPDTAAPEYPLPGLAAAAVPWGIATAVAGPGFYGPVYVLGWVLVDLACVAVLLRHSVPAAAYWVWAVPVLGGFLYARFDLLPAVLMVGAVLLAARRPAWAGAALGAAVAVKLWPVLALPAVLALSTRRRACFGAFVAAGAVFALGALAFGGWDRLVSPLLHQRDRGLEIEAVAATPLLVGRAATPAAWQVDYSSFHAFELTGPGVGVALLLTTLATALVLVTVTAVAVWVLRPGGPVGRETAIWLLLAPLCAYVVVGKVLSPQYLAWMLAAVAAAVALGGAEGLRRWGAVLLVAAALSHIVYPLSFSDLYTDPPSPAMTAVLALRNVLLLVLAVEACRRLRLTLAVRQPAAPRVADVSTVRR